MSRCDAGRTSEEDHEQCTAVEDAAERRSGVRGIPRITSGIDGVTDMECQWKSIGGIPRITSGIIGVRRCDRYKVSTEQCRRGSSYSIREALAYDGVSDVECHWKSWCVWCTGFTPLVGFVDESCLLAAASWRDGRMDSRSLTEFIVAARNALDAN